MDKLTRESAQALFEVGGMDAVWDGIEQDRAAATEEAQSAVTAARYTGFQRGQDVAELRKNVLMTLLILALVSLIPISISLGFRASARQGARELAACRAGDTFDCQAAVQDCYDFGVSPPMDELPGRLSLYKTAYKEATGRDLPPMEPAR